MLITLSIAGIMGAGTVSLHGIVQDSRRASAVSTLLSHLGLARTEAIKRRADVVVCPSADQMHCAGAHGEFVHWQGGYLIYSDHNNNGKLDPGEPTIRTQGVLAGNLLLRSKERTKITFRPNGMTAGSNLTLAFCDPRGPAHARYVVVANTGRARVAKTTTSTVACR